jgi:hypothetical protein
MPRKADSNPIDKIELLIADALEQTYWAYQFVAAATAIRPSTPCW